MDYEVALRQMFDAQRFVNCRRLSAIIAECDRRMNLMAAAAELVDDSLDIWAAGDAFPQPKPIVGAKNTEDI